MFCLSRQQLFLENEIANAREAIIHTQTEAASYFFPHEAVVCANKRQNIEELTQLQLAVKLFLVFHASCFFFFSGRIYPVTQ